MFIIQINILVLVVTLEMFFSIKKRKQIKPVKLVEEGVQRDILLPKVVRVVEGQPMSWIESRIHITIFFARFQWNGLFLISGCKSCVDIRSRDTAMKPKTQWKVLMDSVLTNWLIPKSPTHFEYKIRFLKV